MCTRIQDDIADMSKILLGLSHGSYVRTLALGHLTARRSCPGYWLWAVSNFVVFCPDWPLALGPQIHIFCPDRDQGFPAIAGGPAGGHRFQESESQVCHSQSRILRLVQPQSSRPRGL